jgi:hypothetical protein
MGVYNAAMPRFVLLYHACPPEYVRPSHWDLMLEVAGKLRTWALPCLPMGWEAAHVRTVALFPTCPPLAKTQAIAVERLGDHRIEYVELEGLIGGNRGEVRRIVAGDYEIGCETGESWKVRILDGLVRGDVVLSDRAMKFEPAGG